MVKKTILAIVVVVLLVAVFSGAVQRLYRGYSPYRYYYTYYPVEYYPAYYAYPSAFPPMYYSSYQPPSEYYPYYYSPLASENLYRYGTPQVEVSYPMYTSATEQETPRGVEGQLCGKADGTVYGCYYGMVCDYTATGRTGIGVCKSQ